MSDKKKIVGGLGIKNLNKKVMTADWAFYISEKSKFIGLGASVEFKALEYFFNP